MKLWGEILYCLRPHLTGTTSPIRDRNKQHADARARIPYLDQETLLVLEHEVAWGTTPEHDPHALVYFRLVGESLGQKKEKHLWRRLEENFKNRIRYEEWPQ